MNNNNIRDVCLECQSQQNMRRMMPLDLQPSMASGNLWHVLFFRVGNGAAHNADTIFSFLGLRQKACTSYHCLEGQKMGLQFFLYPEKHTLFLWGGRGMLWWHNIKKNALRSTSSSSGRVCADLVERSCAASRAGWCCSLFASHSPAQSPLDFSAIQIVTIRARPQLNYTSDCPAPT